MAHAQANLVKAVAKGAVKVAAGDKIDDVVKDGLKDIAAGTVGGVAANNIGEAYGQGKLDPLTHKALHAALGAGLGALKNPDDLKNALMTGAFAGSVSEILAEAFSQDLEKVAENAASQTDNMDEAQGIIEDWAHRQADVAKLATVGLAGLFKLDATLAEEVADNALKNNCIKLLITLGKEALKKFSKEGIKKVGKEGVKKEAKEQVKKEVKEEVKKGIIGKKGFEYKNAKYQPHRNKSENINGRNYSGHALDQMQNRGIPYSVVEETIKNGTAFATKEGTKGFYDSINDYQLKLAVCLGI